MNKLSDDFIDKHLPDVKGMSIFGVPVETMSAQELKACVVWLHKAYVRQQEANMKSPLIRVIP